MYKISKQTHLDPFTKCYKNIVVISITDNVDEELKKHLKTVPRSTLSPLKPLIVAAMKSLCSSIYR